MWVRGRGRGRGRPAGGGLELGEKGSNLSCDEHQALLLLSDGIDNTAVCVDCSTHSPAQLPRLTHGEQHHV